MDWLHKYTDRMGGYTILICSSIKKHNNVGYVKGGWKESRIVYLNVVIWIKKTVKGSEIKRVVGRR